MTEFDTAYQNILADIMSKGTEELNERTGHRTKALPGVSFSVSEGFPLLTLRKISVKNFTAEQIWFLTGSRKPQDFLSKYTKIWDGFTNINGVVSSAYGYRWRSFFGRDQMEGLVTLLDKDISSRHGVISMWDPGNDGLDASLSDIKRKNIPCPIGLVVNVIGNKLNTMVTFRSQDMILGAPTDVAGFGLLQRILAARLGTEVGTYTQVIANAHIYDIHYDIAQDLISRKNEHPEMHLRAEKDWYSRASKGDDTLLTEVLSQFETQYRPSPAIKGIEIVM